MIEQQIIVAATTKLTTIVVISFSFHLIIYLQKCVLYYTSLFNSIS